MNEVRVSAGEQTIIQPGEANALYTFADDLTRFQVARTAAGCCWGLLGVAGVAGGLLWRCSTVVEHRGGGCGSEGHKGEGPENMRQNKTEILCRKAWNRASVSDTVCHCH